MALHLLLWFILIVAYFIGWGTTLSQHAKKRRDGWFWTTLIFSPLWIIYRIVEAFE